MTAQSAPHLPLLEAGGFRTAVFAEPSTKSTERHGNVSARRVLWRSSYSRDVHFLWLTSTNYCYATRCSRTGELCRLCNRPQMRLTTNLDHIEQTDTQDVLRPREQSAFRANSCSLYCWQWSAREDSAEFACLHFIICKTISLSKDPSRTLLTWWSSSMTSATLHACAEALGYSTTWRLLNSTGGSF